MSDCGVCLVADDGMYTVMYRCVIVKAGKEWECEECGRRIPKGAQYELASGLTEGEYWNTKTCLLCAEIAKAFYCEGRNHGALWDDLNEVIGDMKIGCLYKLQTPEAKAMIQGMWMREKGLIA